MKIALTQGSKTFGWAVLSDNLRCEIYKRPPLPDNVSLIAISGPSWDPISLDTWNRYNIGIAFVENNVQALHMLDRAKPYDLIVAGSAWMAKWVRDAGLTNVTHITQGIDPDLFKPLPKRAPDGRFVIGCFTKAEYRKGTDVLLAAAAEMQQKYKSVWLSLGVDNIWPHSYLTLRQSPYIKFEQGPTIRESLRATAHANGIDLNRVMWHPMLDNKFIPCLIRECDVCCYVSRGEAGENQSLKEALACGIPCVAAYSTGQIDILGQYPQDLLVYPKYDVKFCTEQGEELAVWPEPNPKDVFECLEHVYRHGSPDISRISDEIRAWTWEKYVDKLFTTIKSIKGIGV